MITLEPVHGGMEEDGGWVALGLSRGGLGRFLKRAQTMVGLSGEVEVLLAGDRTLRRLNRTFRGKNKSTDVLSFPGLAGLEGGHAGDLAISLETAARQAGEHGHTLRDEVRVLLLHGLLHLAGMDHESDAGEMAARETVLRRELRLPGGLIERVEGVEGGSEKKRVRFENDRKKSTSKRGLPPEVTAGTEGAKAKCLSGERSERRQRKRVEP